jgi:hypothetical protein
MASTIANVASVYAAGGDPGNPIFCNVVEFDLKADYDAAGLVGFSTLVLAALPAGKTILAVVPVNTLGLMCKYVAATDTLIFLWCDNAGANGPMIVVPTGDMKAYTDLRLLVISQ